MQYLFISLIGGIGTIIICPCVISMKNTKSERKILMLFEKENLNFWHGRNIHMEFVYYREKR